MNNPAQTTKNLAKTIAKQVAQEPLEILKSARTQVTGQEFSGEQNEDILLGLQKSDENKKVEENQNKLQDEAKSQRLLQALDRELKDINNQNLFKDLQYKISQGIEVYIEEYPELSMEQKQVLKAQVEAVQKQKQSTVNQKPAGGLFGSAKPSRRFGAGQKKSAQDQQTRVEKPVPPSG